MSNITDIDDKILALAEETGEPWWALAYRVEGLFHRAFDALGVRRPTYEPRATGHIPEMIELIATLVERGHAYVADDGRATSTSTCRELARLRRPVGPEGRRHGACRGRRSARQA